MDIQPIKRIPARGNKRIWREDELKEFYAAFIDHCKGLGTKYSSKKACRECAGQIPCMVIIEKKLPLRVIKAKKKHLKSKYALHEYQEAVKEPGRVDNYISSFIAALKKKGEPIPIKVLTEKHILNEASPLFAEDYFKSHDPRLATILLKGIAQDPSIRFNPKNETLEYVQPKQ